MKLLVDLPSKVIPPLAAVGGKALSLYKLAALGFRVPPGIVLTTEFFAPWFERLAQTATWSELAEASSERWSPLCDDLKAQATDLPLDALQASALEQLRGRLAKSGSESRYAARSSSPEEDLASTSFAGGYETRLGVPAEKVEQAIRACFLSSLDFRVFTYKRANGLNPFAPNIAVLIQEQIDSESAGVAFSMNPLTNDYDEAVINANWGLGETVVAGLATPDHFLIDKVGRTVLSSEIGAKQCVHRLHPDGGTLTEVSGGCSPGLACLDSKRALEITDALCQIEAAYGFPVDVEWAVANGKLYLLQARPITAFIPLPPEMKTRPGERRRLYADISLSSGLTINAPISTMGLEWMQEVMFAMFKPYIGRFQLSIEPRRCLWFFSGHRMYQDLSNVLWFISPQRLGRAGRESDALMAETIFHLDRKRYRAERRPSWLGFSVFRILPRLSWGLSKLAWKILLALLFPRWAAARHHQDVAAYSEAIEEIERDPATPLSEFRALTAEMMARQVFSKAFPAMAAYLLAHNRLDSIVGRRDSERLALAQKLKLGFRGNVVVEMGRALFELAQRLDPQRFNDLPRLLDDLNSRRLPADFLEGWDNFLKRFGCRGPSEMDLGQPRYGDDPSIALGQMARMVANGQTFDPGAAQERLIDERLHAYEQLRKKLGWIRRLFLRRAHTLLDLFGGTRDTPKQMNLLAYHAVRKRVIREGETLQREGRLDTSAQIFDLSFHDIEKAALDPTLDLRDLHQQRVVFKRQLERQAHTFPGLIDSRGRILRPPVGKDVPGEIHGTPISSGIVSGRVKVLRSPDEKAVEPGEVLVAYTTDPGWTPLFVNAAAIILEVGGILQHGAVVAREYGKPCVAGIDRVTTRLKDGQLVEVDGSLGIVRQLDTADPKAPEQQPDEQTTRPG